MSRMCTSLVLGACLGLAQWTSAGVVAGGSTVAGKTIGEWTADWWNWAGGVSPSVTADTDGSAATKGQSGPVFFVAGTSGGSAVTRDFTVPEGKFVLFPLINWVTAAGPDPGFSNTAEEVEALTNQTIDPSNLFASIDGVDVTDLGSHRERSQTNFTLTVVPDSFGFPPGTYTDANSDGYWLMLEPLSAGRHTLHFGGTAKEFVGPDPSFTFPGFTVDTTANVTVGGAQPIPLPPAAFAAVPLMGALAAYAGLRGRRALQL